VTDQSGWMMYDAAVRRQILPNVHTAAGASTTANTARTSLFPVLSPWWKLDWMEAAIHEKKVLRCFTTARGEVSVEMHRYSWGPQNLCHVIWPRFSHGSFVIYGLWLATINLPTKLLKSLSPPITKNEKVNKMCEMGCFGVVWVIQGHCK